MLVGDVHEALACTCRSAPCIPRASAPSLRMPVPPVSVSRRKNPLTCSRENKSNGASAPPVPPLTLTQQQLLPTLTCILSACPTHVSRHAHSLLCSSCSHCLAAPEPTLPPLHQNRWASSRSLLLLLCSEQHAITSQSPLHARARARPREL